MRHQLPTFLLLILLSTALRAQPRVLHTTGHTATITCMQYSPDGRRLATSADNNNSIHFWDTQTQRLLYILKERGLGGVTFRFHPDGQSLLAVYGSGKVIRWGLTPYGGGWEMQRWDFPAMTLRYPEFSPDGTLLALPLENKIQILDVLSFDLRYELSISKPNFELRVSFSPDNRFLCINTTGNVLIKEIATDSVVQTLAECNRYDMNLAAFFNHKNQVITVSPRGVLGTWEFPSGKLLEREHLPDSTQIRLVIPGADKNHLGVLYYSGNMLVRSIADRSQQKVYSFPEGEGPNYLFAMHPQQGQIATMYQKYGLRFIEAATGNTQGIIKGHDAGVNDLLFSPDGKRLLSANKDGSIAIWRTDSFKIERILSAHQNWVTSLCISPDGYTLASAGRDSLAKLWDLASGKLLHTIRTHRAQINTIAFSPDGRCLATGGADRAVWLHILDEEENSKSVLIDKKNPQGIYGLQFSPDGQLLASSSLMGEVKLWNLKKRRRPQIIATEIGWSAALKFNQDGKFLAFGKNRDILIWDMEKQNFAHTFSSVHQPFAQDLAWLEDEQGRKVTISVGLDDQVMVAQLARGNHTDEFIHFDYHCGGTTCIDISPDKQYYATGGWDNTILLYGLQKQEPRPLWTLSHLASTKAWVAIAQNGTFHCDPTSSSKLEVLEKR